MRLPFGPLVHVCYSSTIIFFIIFAKIFILDTSKNRLNTSTHNLNFGGKIRKIAIPLYYPVSCDKKLGKRGHLFNGHVYSLQRH